MLLLTTVWMSRIRLLVVEKACSKADLATGITPFHEKTISLLLTEVEKKEINITNSDDLTITIPCRDHLVLLS